MSSLSRRTATAGLLALTLLAVPSAALAAGPDARPTQAEAGPDRAAEARPEQARGEREPAQPVPSATPSARRERPAAGAAGGSAAGRSAARPERTRPEQTRPERTRPDRSAADPAKERSGKSAGTSNPGAPARTADPRGNNGTFKVDGPVLDTGRGNEPHVSCAFRLSFFGYDAGQLADISVTAIAPTPGGTTRVDGLQLISTGSAKGGEYDSSYPATGTWDAGDLGLDPTQRQHVKVSVESFNADGSEVPGGAKSKVFWLEPCAPAAPAAPVEDVPATTSGTAVIPVLGPRAVAPAVPAAPAAPATAVLAGSVSAQTAAPSAVVAAPAALVQPFSLPPVSARASARPAQLPFTGSPQTLILLLGGVVALAGGAALLVAVRRTA